MRDLTLKVKVIKAILTHNTQIGSLMDPFVVLKMGTTQKRGKTFDEAGDMPQFNQQFQFPIRENLTTFHLIVYDEDVTIDDLVGEVQIELQPILLRRFTQKKWYSLKYNGKKPAGKIMLEFECKRAYGLSQSQSQIQIKKLLKPHIHPIGYPQSKISTQIHNLKPKPKLKKLDYRILNGSHQRQVKKVFSFRDNTVKYTIKQKRRKENQIILNQCQNYYQQPWSSSSTLCQTIFESITPKKFNKENQNLYYRYQGKNQINGGYYLRPQSYQPQLIVNSSQVNSMHPNNVYSSNFLLRMD